MRNDPVRKWLWNAMRSCDIRMPNSAGFGDYTESGQVIPAILNGEQVNFTAQMYLDDEPPIAGDEKSGVFRKSTPTRRSPSSTTHSLAY
jgi:acetoacetate decarboxylase